MTAIEIRNARKTFKAGKRTVVAVDDVSLSVPEGGVMGIVGESGCGKSTLARLILGLLPADMTNTRSHSSATMPRSCVIRMVAASVSSRTVSSRSRICA